MKKYFNKALMYQWFHSAKGVIGLGIIIWGFISHKIIMEKIWQVRNDIAFEFNNYFSTNSIWEYTMLGLIFMAVYYAGMGSNKKNNSMFLYSGPTTKKSIKINMLICLFINLLIFILVYLYIIIMAYIQNKELLSIVNGFWIVMLIELSKLLLVGMIGILSLMIFDMLFINSIAAAVLMLTVFPLTIGLIDRKIRSILGYIPCGKEVNVMTYLIKVNGAQFSHPYFCRYSLFEIRLKYLCSDIIACLIALAVMSIIFIVMTKKNKLENSVHVFSSKKAENFVFIVAAVYIGIFIESVIAERFIYERIWSSSYDGVLYGAELILTMGFEIIAISVIAVTSFIAIKRISKKIG